MWRIFKQSNKPVIMEFTKKECYKKIEFYSKEITDKKPNVDTLLSIFRVYYDALKLISRALYHVSENPWHPENDYRDDIFESLTEIFDKLEEIRVKATTI